MWPHVYQELLLWLFHSLLSMTDYSRFSFTLCFIRLPSGGGYDTDSCAVKMVLACVNNFCV